MVPTLRSVYSGSLAMQHISTSSPRYAEPEPAPAPSPYRTSWVPTRCQTICASRHDFFSKSGFRAELVALAEATPDRYRLVAPDDLLDEPYGS